MPINDYTEQVDDQRGFWARVRDRLRAVPDGEEDVDPEYAGRTRGGRRVADGRAVFVSVRMNAAVFNDARIAADGLKEGKQQIVNLERATPGMAERILDFLSGVTYAVDGTVECVGEKVYLFVPASVDVEVDGGSEPI